jgi:hypothetical protein
MRKKMIFGICMVMLVILSCSYAAKSIIMGDFEQLPLKENGGETIYGSSDGKVIVYINPMGADRVFVFENGQMIPKDFALTEDDVISYQSETGVLTVVEQNRAVEKQTKIEGGKPVTTDVTTYTVSSVSIELNNNNRASSAVTTYTESQSPAEHINDAKTEIPEGYPDLATNPILIQLGDSIREDLRQQTEAQIAQLPPGSIIPLYATPTDMTPEETKTYIEQAAGIKIPEGVYIGPAYLAEINKQLGKEPNAPLDEDSVSAIAELYTPNYISANRNQFEESVPDTVAAYSSFEYTDNAGNKKTLYGTAYIDPATGEVVAFQDKETGTAFTVADGKAACAVNCGSSAGKKFSAKVSTGIIDIADCVAAGTCCAVG